MSPGNYYPNTGGDCFQSSRPGPLTPKGEAEVRALLQVWQEHTDRARRELQSSERLALQSAGSQAVADAAAQAYARLTGKLPS